MPNHTPEHLKKMHQRSSAIRRMKVLERAIITAPPLSKEQVEQLQLLLDAHPIA